MKIKSSLVFFLLALTVLNAKAQERKLISTSVQKLTLEFSLDQNGRAAYAVLLGDKQVIKNSHLGFIIDHKKLDSNFQIIKIDSSAVNESWNPIWGEVKTIRNQYHQLIVQLQQQSAPYWKINILFRVFEDGVGFRYEFPLQNNLKFFTVNDELTEFNLTADHKAFWIPADYDSNEYPYTTSNLSEVNAWKFPIISSGTYQTNIPDQSAVQTPLMLKTPEGLYINIHEAALQNYSTMQLHVDRTGFGLKTNLVPDAVGNKVYLRTPAKTPWRTIIVSDKATDILASKMILNLNEPSVIKNDSWIKPTKFIGVWWEMQTGKGSWSYTDHIDSLSKDES